MLLFRGKGGNSGMGRRNLDDWDNGLKSKDAADEADPLP